jgi:hypothetical protein
MFKFKRRSSTCRLGDGFAHTLPVVRMDVFLQPVAVRFIGVRNEVAAIEITHLAPIPAHPIEYLGACEQQCAVALLHLARLFRGFQALARPDEHFHHKLLASPGQGLGMQGVRECVSHLHEIGNVPHFIDDVRDIAQAVEDGPVRGAPVPLFESIAGLRELPDVVLLNGHGIRHARLQYALQRRGKVAHTGRRQVLGVIGKDVKQRAAQDVFMPHVGAAQSCFVGRCNGEVGKEHQVRRWAEKNISRKSREGWTFCIAQRFASEWVAWVFRALCLKSDAPFSCMMG